MRAVPDPVGGRRGRGKASGPDATTKLLNQPLQGSSTLGLLIMEKKSSLLKLLEWGGGTWLEINPQSQINARTLGPPIVKSWNILCNTVPLDRQPERDRKLSVIHHRRQETRGFPRGSLLWPVFKKKKSSQRCLLLSPRWRVPYRSFEPRPGQ